MNILSLRRFWPQQERAAVSSTTIGWVALTGMILASATYYSFAKELTTALSPMTLVIMSELLTALFILFSVGLLPAVRSYTELTREQIMALLGVGLTSGISAPALLFTGLKSTSAVNATLFGNTEMLFLLLLAALLLQQRLRVEHLMAEAAIFVGILCIAFRGFSEGFSLFPGDILLLLASLFYSFGDLLFRKYLHDVHISTVILTRSMIAVVGGTAILAFSPGMTIGGELQKIPFSLLGVLLGFAFISRFLNITCFYQALDRLPVATLSVFGNLAIISSMVFAGLYLGEYIQGYQIIGAAFIIGGTILMEVLGGHHPSEEHQVAHLMQRQAQRV